MLQLMKAMQLSISKTFLEEQDGYCAVLVSQSRCGIPSAFYVHSFAVIPYNDSEGVNGSKEQ